MTELPFGLGTVSPFFAGVLCTIGAYFAFQMLNSARRAAGTLLGFASLALMVATLAGPDRVAGWLGL